MANPGPIIIVEDDDDDQEIICDAFAQLQVKNEVKLFVNAPEAFNYLKSTTDVPFIILSDVNLPMMNGLEFKRQIDADPELRNKSIPFVFFSTSASKASVDIAYKTMTIQGFFEKPGDYEQLKQTLFSIYNYWRICKHPNVV